MKKFTKIAVDREDESRQLNLIQSDIKPTSYWFPPVFRDETNFKRILYSATNYLGIDFEFPTSGPRKYIPTIIGISTLEECAGIYVNREQAVNLLLEIIYTARQKGLKLVGHSVIGAEIPVIIETCGIKMGIEEFDDSLLRHFLINQDFAKQASKTEDDDKGALGFMNLWTTASMVLDIPAYKQCRGKYCDQIICPKHDPRGYCAIDAYCSIASNKQHIIQFKEWELPERAYEDLRELTGIAEEMTKKGIKVDMAWVNKLEGEADKIKESLFPVQEDGTQIPFNPRSSDQVLKYFNENGIRLESNEKKSIEKALSKIIDTMGLADFSELGTIDSLSEPIENLYKQYQYKASGKGLAPWFDQRYRDKDDFIHPRWITVGASTTRYSSSKPNFQNIPARGFGALVRGAIIPRDESLILAKSDQAQLELRMVLYLSGVDPAIIGDDAFTWLVDNSGGAFDRAAELAKDTPRGIAKTVSHAGSLGEGFSLLSGNELMLPRTKKLIEVGALRPYMTKYGAPFNWEFCDKVVAFTGANLAERIFGSKTYENRKKALDIQEDIYFKKFSMIRDWQKKTLDFVQDNKFVRYQTGNFIRLNGRDEDNAKIALAALMQGTSAQYMQQILLKYIRQGGQLPIIFCHDEYVLEIPRNWTHKRIAEEFEFMGAEVPILQGFKGKYKVIVGNTWLEGTKKVPKEFHDKCLWPLEL